MYTDARAREKRKARFTERRSILAPNYLLTDESNTAEERRLNHFRSPLVVLVRQTALNSAGFVQFNMRR